MGAPPHAAAEAFPIAVPRTFDTLSVINSRESPIVAGSVKADGGPRSPAGKASATRRKPAAVLKTPGAVLDHIALRMPLTKVWAKLVRQVGNEGDPIWVYPMASEESCVSPNPIQVPLAELREQRAFKRNFCLVPGLEDFVLYLGS